MLTNFEKVREFNISFGIGRSATPDDKIKKLRWDLIREESDELQEAIKTKNLPEIIDALCDILYVIYGAADSFGDNLDNYINYSCIQTENENIDFVIPDSIKKIKNLAERMNAVFENTTIHYNLYMDYYEKQMAVLHTFLFTSYAKMDAVMQQLTILHRVVYNMAHIFGFDLDMTFDMVHKSNMSKLAETEEIAKQTVQWYMENEKRYDSPAYRLSTIKVNDQHRWVIYNQSSGKALKSIHYFPVDFTQLFQ